MLLYKDRTRTLRLLFILVSHQFNVVAVSCLTILTGKRNATIELCQVRHVIHKHELHELNMTRTLSKASGLFEFINVCLSGILAYVYEYLTAVAILFPSE